MFVRQARTKYSAESLVTEIDHLKRLLGKIDTTLMISMPLLKTKAKDTIGEAGRHSNDIISTNGLRQNQQFLTKHIIKTIHILVQENIQLFRPVKEKLGLKSLVCIVSLVNVESLCWTDWQIDQN
jgi:hypothetical protein